MANKMTPGAATRGAPKRTIRYTNPVEAVKPYSPPKASPSGSRRRTPPPAGTPSAGSTGMKRKK